MIDHTGVTVSDFEKSKTFYTSALASIGYKLLVEVPAAVMRAQFAGLGDTPRPDFWISP